MVTANRPGYVKRAIKAFRHQTYPHKRLLIYDTSANQPGDRGVPPNDTAIRAIWATPRALTIGDLRNCANAEVRNAEILATWDDDDWSHPHRVADQVAELTRLGQGFDVVGYNAVPFWHELKREAWLYRRNVPLYAIGSSLTYWRKSWSDHPFMPFPVRPGATSEDYDWLKRVKCKGVDGTFRSIGPSGSSRDDMEPRMVCRIHADNHGDYADATLRNSASWTPVPDWGEFTSYVMEGKL